MKTNLRHYLSSVYFISQPLYVLGIFVAHYQEVYCIQQLVCIMLFSWLFHPNLDNRQSTKKHNTYQLLYIYSTPPDDGLQVCPKHEEADGWNKLRINSASSWFSLHRCIKMHGQQNIKKTLCLCIFLKIDNCRVGGVVYILRNMVYEYVVHKLCKFGCH